MSDLGSSLAMQDFDFHRCTRRCATTGREFVEGETYYSVLRAQGTRLDRLDYSQTVWHGPPENSIAWWKSAVPHRDEKKPQPPSGEILFSLFEALTSQPEHAALRYVLALLLVRRKVLRMDEQAAETDATIRVHCPRHDMTFDVPVALPRDDQHAEQLQAELDRLLSPAA